ncbi:hypothetical protein Hypma_005630 [Hypsizygus marmoreus]|uniref:Uncharacterized protein n=1 Tax=Hypsizygus marmoreus TaxID=39966 RepID=A0A369JXJ8_HYPMA|nr:hypothetical protein Hypma_005630 [Hypsizygus marmoreus]
MGPGPGLGTRSGINFGPGHGVNTKQLPLMPPVQAEKMEMVQALRERVGAPSFSGPLDDPLELQVREAQNHMNILSDRMEVA